MEQWGAWLVFGLLAVAGVVLWAVNRGATRAGLPVDIRSRPRPVRGRSPDRADVGGDTFTAGFDAVDRGRDPGDGPEPHGHREESRPSRPRGEADTGP